MVTRIQNVLRFLSGLFFQAGSRTPKVIQPSSQALKFQTAFKSGYISKHKQKREKKQDTSPAAASLPLHCQLHTCSRSFLTFSWVIFGLCEDQYFSVFFLVNLVTFLAKLLLNIVRRRLRVSVPCYLHSRSQVSEGFTTELFQVTMAGVRGHWTSHGGHFCLQLMSYNCAVQSNSHQLCFFFFNLDLK